MANEERRFLYHAHALAVGGYLTRPCCQIITSQTSVALPIVGGTGSAKEGPFSRDGISFKSAHSEVVGNESVGAKGEKIYNSLATVTIEGLNISDVVTADKVVARLTCETPAKDGDLPICPVGSYFVNLRIADVVFDLQPKEDLCRPEPISNIAALAKSSGSSRHALVPLFKHASPEMPRKMQAAGLTSGIDDGIVVPGFGTVYIGEYLVTDGARRLTMLRLEMGSPIEGSLEVGGVGGNGRPFP